MKSLMTSLLAIAIATVSLAQKTIYDDNVVKRPVAPFHAIKASTGVQVMIAPGNEEALAISVLPKELENKVRTEVVDGELKIYVETDWKVWDMPKNWKVKAYVSYKNLDKVTASSGAVVKGDINAVNLATRQSSGAIVELKGSVTNLDTDASSGGMFKGYELQTEFLRAEASSGGGVQAFANKEVSAKASSGGYVKYKGGALIRDINVNSGGSVKRAD